MKKIVIVGAALIAMPAAANAQGYAQIQTGFDSVSVLGESDEGIAYGGAIGYDFTVGGNWFIGVEGSIDDSSTKYCVSDVDVVGDRLCAKTGRDLSAVLRLGTNLGEKGQLYVLGGYTNARLKLTYTDGVDSESIGDNGDGFRLGAGYKQNFSGNLYGKIEYRYSNYESDFSRHNALVALGMNF